MLGLTRIASFLNSAKKFLGTIGSASGKVTKGTTNTISKGVEFTKKHPYITLGALGTGYAGYNALNNYYQNVTAEPNNNGYAGTSNMGIGMTDTATNNSNTSLPPIKENFKHSPLYNLSDWELEEYRRTWGDTSDYRRAKLEKEANGANPYVHEVEIPSWNIGNNASLPSGIRDMYNYAIRSGMSPREAEMYVRGYVHEVDPRLIAQNQQIAPVSTNIKGNLGSLDLNNPDIQNEFKLALISKGLPADVANYALAQAMLETGYGKKLVGNNNFFNITVPSSQRGKGLGNTRNVQEYINGAYTPMNVEFRNYQDLNSLASGYVDLLQRKYNGAYNAKNIDEFTTGLNGWATDPQYASKIAQIYNSKFRG